MKKKNRYSQIIERIFFIHYKPGINEIQFERAEISNVAEELGIQLPKNLGDVIYSFRYRNKLPSSIRRKAPADREWIIRPAGRGIYKFVVARMSSITPTKMLAETKIPELVCRPLAAQIKEIDVIAMFEFELIKEDIVIIGEKHYSLVNPDELLPEELALYNRRPE